MSTVACPSVPDPRRGALRGLAILTMFAATLASAATDPVARCESAKEAAVGRYGACRARAAARAIKRGRAPAYEACARRLRTAYERAEKRGDEACPTTGDVDLAEATYRACIDDVSDAVLGGAAPPGTSRDEARCDARRVKTAAAYVRCRQHVVAKATRRGDQPNPAKLARCAEKVDRKLARAERGRSCSSANDGAPIVSGLDACAAPLAPELAALDGTIVVMNYDGAGRPKQIGIAIEPTADSVWLFDGLEYVYFAEGALARDLVAHIGREARVRGDVVVGLEFFRTIFLQSYELSDAAEVTRPVESVPATHAIEGVIVVVDRHADGRPRALGVAPDAGDAVPLETTNKSEELRYRIGRRMRVDGALRADGRLRVGAYVDLAGSPLVHAGDGFRMSFLAGGLDDDGAFMGGVELDALIAFDGKIFAGTSYRKNTQAESPDPMPPGAQVLALDEPDGRWRVDFAVLGDEGGAAPRMVFFDVLRFETDGTGTPIDPPVELLAAVSGNGEIYLRSAGPAAEWFAAGLRDVVAAAAGAGERPDARSVVSHTDRLTGVSHVFAGAGVGRRGDGGGVYRGSYDAALPGRIAWEPVAELPIRDADFDRNPRIMGLTAVGGAVYASMGRQLLRRDDGPTPSWTEVYEDTLRAGRDSIRRASRVRGAGGGDAVLFGIEGFDSRTVRVDPNAGDAVIEEFSAIGAVAETFHGLVGYNGPTTRLLEDGSEATLMGMHLFRPRRAAIGPEPEMPDVGRFYDYADGLVLWRHEDGTYAFARIVDETLEVHPPLVGVRTILTHSPFASEEDVIYFGGFDHDGHLFHNTAWIFKAHLDDVRAALLPLS